MTSLLYSFFLSFSLSLMSLSSIATTPAYSLDFNFPNIYSSQLDNGLEIIVIEDHRTPIVTHMIWYRVGASDEQPGKSGIAHLFEHLMFKGTKSNPNDAYQKFITRIGGEENAFTSQDYTAYYQRFPKQHLTKTMQFEADRMRNLILTNEVIEKEKLVVIEERKQVIDSQPIRKIYEAAEAAFFRNHPYGIPIIGWKHEIEKLDKNSLLEFYKKYYHPNNAVLVVAGDVTLSEVKKLANQTYGQIKQQPTLPKRQRPLEPPFNANIEVTMKDPKVQAPMSIIMYQTDSFLSALKKNDIQKATAMELAMWLLSNNESSYLYQKLVANNGPAATAEGYYSGTERDYGTISFYLLPKENKKLKDVEIALEKAIDQKIAEGFSEKELEVAKFNFISSLIYAQDSQVKLAKIIGMLLVSDLPLKNIIEYPQNIKDTPLNKVNLQLQTLRQNKLTARLLPENQEQNQ